MGLPAIKHQSRSATRRPHLSVVKPGTRRKATTSTSRARATVARHNFRLFAIAIMMISVLGIGRVWLSVQAVEASIDANRLRDSIKNERYEGDMLEVRQSALGSPSRIQAIAGRALGMAPAKSVTYLDITKPEKTTGAAARANTTAATPRQARAGMGFDAAIARMMDLAAGEAQVLLVGDVGLASSR